MSCEHNRHKYFEQIGPALEMSPGELERRYQAGRREPGNQAELLSANAKTLRLFGLMRVAGLKPPTHSADGLPKTASRLGYAAIYDLLAGAEAQSQGESNALQLATPAGSGEPAAIFWANPENRRRYDAQGYDPDGYDRWGYTRRGFTRQGWDREGFDREGYDAEGYNRLGLDKDGRDRDGYNAAGYNDQGLDRDGYDIKGYKDGFDREGYNLDGFDQDGYDRAGYDSQGYDRQGYPSPLLTPGADGYYPDGFDAQGFGRDGYGRSGRDRWGFDREGYNAAGYDRNGLDRNGMTTNGYDRQGYDSRGYDYRGFDRLGYNKDGYDRQGYTWTGYDEHGLDRNRQPRMTRDKKTGQLVPMKYNPSGWDKDGYDEWGFHHLDGLTAPDAQGLRRNRLGWVYDEQTQECYDPQDSRRRMAHKEHQTFAWTRPWRRKGRILQPGRIAFPSSYAPADNAPEPPITPLAPMSREAYECTWPGTSHLHYLSYGDRLQALNHSANIEGRWQASLRVLGDERACADGVLLRCPKCRQFTGGQAHNCPQVQNHVLAFSSGAFVYGGNRGLILVSPHNPRYDPHYSESGYREGRDPEGYDRRGYDPKGFNRSGYTADGFDLLGYDRDGYDRKGYNRQGLDRFGERRTYSLDEIREVLGAGGGDLLDNEDLAALYSRVATGLVGQARRVHLVEGEGFATDLQGSIQADPYPLGRGADPRHNLVVTKAGLYHEIGHEQFTDPAVWAHAVQVAQSEKAVEGLDAGRRSLTKFLNLVEDGRMERHLCDRYAGVEEVLAASCRLKERWDEATGPNIPAGSQVYGALLYTALPFYRVRPEVRQAMPEQARKLFDELEPVVKRAVLGKNTEEAYRAAVHLARRFEEEGLLGDLPAGEPSTPLRPPPGGEERAPGAVGTPGGKGQGDEGEGAAPPGSAGPPEGEGAGTGAGGQGESLRDVADRYAPLSNDELDAALERAERDATTAIEAGQRARTRPDQMGKPLHRPLSGNDESEQRYRDLRGFPKTVAVSTPVVRDARLLAKLEKRRPEHQQIATRMAATLRAIREQAEQRLRRQGQGRLDRRDLARAVKGSHDVYKQVKEIPATSFAASVAVDMSGSMGHRIQSGELYDAAMVLGDTFDLLEMPYEVRAFGSSSMQVKSMGDPRFEAGRAASLAAYDLGGTNLGDTAGLAISALQSSPQKNRLFVSLTDGQLNDHVAAAEQLKEARRQGLVTFGIYLGHNANRQAMDELYGLGNWTSIEKLSDMPAAVGQRLATLFRALKK